MTYEKELIQNLINIIGKDSFYIEESSDLYFKKLANAFPILGSKINWKNVPKSIEDDGNKSYSFLDFFVSISDKFELSGTCIIIGDSAIDSAIIMPIDMLRNCLSAIIEIPQHHYFISKEFSWCFSYTMEENMAFGFSNL